jgi:predicted transcriptional regulator
MRHIEIKRIRQARAERRAIERAQQELEVTKQSFEQSIEEHIEQQVSPTLDSWCLKFPDEKQYFSAFGLEMMRKIGRLFSIESVKELDGH